MAILLSLGAAASAETLEINFATGEHGFVPGFADYSTHPPLYSDEMYELTAAWQPLPAHLGAANAWFISGSNRSDDLFMYFKRQVTGLLPNTEYSVGFTINFATQEPFGSAGIGGSPAHAVYLMAGATAIEPMTMIVPDGTFRNHRLNIDKGNQTRPGPSALVLGDISRPPGGPNERWFELVSRTSGTATLNAQSDSAGSLWLFFGTESGFEGRTQLYYTDFRATLTIVPESNTLVMVAAAGALVLAVGASRYCKLTIRSSRETSSIKGAEAAPR